MAAELGLPDYENMDKGICPPGQTAMLRQYDRKMVKFAEAVLAWNYKTG
jgi:hypothetical protein